jgi:hypothetical protein
MTTPIEELKIRARLLRKALGQSESAAVARALAISKKRRWVIPQTWTLAHCLNLVSAEAGFDQWEHARGVLAGEAHIGDDMGTLWYGDECSALMNRWFSSYGEAQACLRDEGAGFLLPYVRQFIIVDAAFIETLGLSPSSPHWESVDRDLVAGYGKPGWHALILERLLQVHRRSS